MLFNSRVNIGKVPEINYTGQGGYSRSPRRVHDISHCNKRGGRSSLIMSGLFNYDDPNHMS